MTNYFQFKQFTIQQKNAAMKVGTDSVLLGAWTTVKEGAILDIGSGTGLLALMLAQRTQSAQIETIEIDKAAYLQTIENVVNSNWLNRIKTHHADFLLFKPTHKYDLIICNPPFFIDSTKSPNYSRNIARHTDNLSFVELINAVSQILKSNGIFSVILPIMEKNKFIQIALTNELFLIRKCIVRPNSTKKSKRVLLEFSFKEDKLQEENLIIEKDKRHHYTKEYISLTQDFYLNF